LQAVLDAIAVLAKTLGEYGDPKAVYSGELTVDLPRQLEANR